MVKNYRDLEVWQKAMDLVVASYKLTKSFPKDEMYGLTNQLRRAAASIPANIAEGRQRQYSKEFLQFLSIASGSLAELETHMQIAGRLHYTDEHHGASLLERTEEVGRMLTGLKKAIGARKKGLGIRE